jgi:hypothetical protein
LSRIKQKPLAFGRLKKPPQIIDMSTIQGDDTFLDIENAHLRVTGNVHAENVNLGSIRVNPTYGLSTVTNVGNTTSNTVQFTNPTTSLTTTGNVEIGGILTLNTVQLQTNETLASVTNVGNATSETVQFTNSTTSLVASGNVEVGTANLFVDTVNSRVGVGTTSPNEKLDIYGRGMRIHDPTSYPKIDLLRGGSSRVPDTDTFGATNYVDWRITSGPELKFQQQYTNANSGNLLDVMTLNHNTGNVEIPGYLKTGNPAFYVRKTTSTSHNTYIIYDSVDTNKGSCYNSSNGVFTCPVNGIYTFTWGSIGNDTDTVFRLYIHINNAQVGGGIHLRADTSATGSNYSTGDRTATLSLSANDTVRIKYAADNGTSSLYGGSYTHFQGHLISYT